jgi:hypothetical protein
LKVGVAGVALGVVATFSVEEEGLDEDGVIDDEVLDGDDTLDGNEEASGTGELDVGELTELEEVDELVVVALCSILHISKAVSLCMQTNSEFQLSVQ